MEGETREKIISWTLGILFFVMLFLVLFLTIGGTFSTTSIELVPCYDVYHNLIQNTTCEKEVMCELFDQWRNIC